MKRKVCSMSAVLFASTLLSWTAAFPQSPAENPGIVRLRYATIVVPNYDDALRWYTDVFGLERVEEGTFGAGLRWIMFAMCNSSWGELMHRLKGYAEGKNPGPLWTE